MNSISPSELAFTYAWHTAFNCSLGLMTAFLGKSDKIVCITACVIHGLAIDIFEIYAYLTTGGSQKNPQAFYAKMFAGNIIIDIVAIFAFRRLNIIGTYGTVIFASVMTIIVVDLLKKAVA